jgi:hypothetical protein
VKTVCLVVGVCCGQHVRRLGFFSGVSSLAAWFFVAVTFF